MIGLDKVLSTYIINNDLIPLHIIIKLREYLEKSNYDTKGINNIIRTIFEYNKTIKRTREEENKHYQSIIENRKKVITPNKQEIFEEPKTEIKVIEDNSLKLDISYYMREINETNNDEDIIQILPDKNSDNYTDIINLILLNLFEYRIMIDKLLKEEEDKELIVEKDIVNKKISCIKNYQKRINNNPKTVEKKNHVIFLTTNSNNICIKNDIERDIDPEYYSDIKELLDSIIDGTLKNVKAFTENKNLTGLSEVKYRKARITFKRVSSDTYVVIHAFIKKWDNALHYRNFLVERYLLYKEKEPFIIDNLNNEDYLNKNDQIHHAINNLLTEKEVLNGKVKSKNKQTN